MMTARSNKRRATRPASTEATFRLGRYTVEPIAGRILNGRQSIRLEPRVMAVLTYLAARPGEVISKQTLKDEIWGTRHVVDEAVKRCITQIRKAFQDDARDPQIVATLPKRGYQLVAEVRRPQPGGAIGKLIHLSTLKSFRAMALAAVTAIAVIHASRPMSELPPALDLYQTARDQYHRYDREGIESAIALYEHLLAQNAADSRALAGLSDALMQQYLELLSNLVYGRPDAGGAVRGMIMRRASC